MAWLKVLAVGLIPIGMPVMAVDATEISSSTTWQLLVHHSDNHAQIQDPQFLLTRTNFSAKAELAATIELFQQNPTAAWCRFPARGLYLARMGVIADELQQKVPSCEPLQRFLNDVRVDELSLVYAVPELVSDTSMMGHVFLRTQSTYDDGLSQAHTLAFFTKIDSINPLRLLYQNTVSGMAGYMVLRPYAIDLKQYQQVEQRTVWQYQLTSTPEQRRLLQLHIYELKDLKIDYYFQSFNCATLTLELLGLLDPHVNQHRGWIVSPSDVVKAAHQANLVQSTVVARSDQDWLAIGQQQLPTAQVRELDAAINGSTKPLTTGVLQSSLALNYARAAGRVAIASKQRLVSDQMQLLNQWPELTAEDEAWHAPTSTPGDSGWGARVIDTAQGQAYEFDWLIHGFDRDSNQRARQHEGELKLGHVRLRYDPQQQWQLRQFDLYSMLSLPTNGWAYQAQLGYQRLSAQDAIEPENVSTLSSTDVHAGMGLSRPLSQHSQWFALAGLGASIGPWQQPVYGYIDVGLISQPLDSTKLQVRYRQTSKQYQQAGISQKAQGQWTFNLNHYLSEHWQLSVRYEQAAFAPQQQADVGVGIWYLF